MASVRRSPIFVPQPRPLLTSPSRGLWEAHAGQEYKVFVDESFFEFFGLVAREGFFCFGAVAIPAVEYSAVADALVPVQERFRQLSGASEIKHSEFRRFDYGDQHRIAAQVRDILARHGAAIAGFFTPVRAYVLERIRSIELLGKADAIPPDHEALYKAAVAKLEQDFQGPGRSAAIGSLLHHPVGCLAHFLAYLECRFELIYDPRERSEDRGVKARVDSYVELMKLLKRLPPGEDRNDIADYFLGFRADKRSDEEVGLQLADFVAGEVRRFMQANEDLLRFGASPRLITPASREPMMTMTEMGGQLFKNGVLNRMPPGLRARFSKPDPQRRTVFHLLAKLLASGILTCHSAWGTPRDLMPFEGLIWDQMD